MTAPKTSVNIQKHIKPTKLPTITKALFDNLVQDGLKEEFTVDVLVTPDVAKHALEVYNIGNRTISKINVDRYARDMTNKRWGGHVGDELCVDNTGRLNNGQQRLSAIVKSQTIQPMTFRFGIDAAKKLKEGSGRSKTLADKMGMMNASEKNRHVRASVIRQAYCFTMNPHNPTTYQKNYKPTDSELGDTIIKPYGEQIKNSVEYVLGAGIRNVCVESDAALVHWLICQSSHGKKAANEFIYSLASGENLNGDNPIFVARNKMMSIADSKWYRTQSNKDAAVGLLVKAFNAHIAGEKWGKQVQGKTNAIPVVSGLKTIGKIDIYAKKV